MSRMPAVYREWGGPLRYQDDVTGVLPQAVRAYFEARATPEQLELVRDYCEYYINAPCWDANPHHDAESRAELTVIREQIKHLHMAGEITNWIHRCLEIGIDPL